jgi:hypothetical protein
MKGLEEALPDSSRIVPENAAMQTADWADFSKLQSQSSSSSNKTD